MHRDVSDVGDLEPVIITVGAARRGGPERDAEGAGVGVGVAKHALIASGIIGCRSADTKSRIPSVPEYVASVEAGIREVHGGPNRNDRVVGDKRERWRREDANVVGLD